MAIEAPAATTQPALNTSVASDAATIFITGESHKPWVVRQPIWACALVLFIVVAAYCVLFDSDRYASSAHIVVQRTDLTPGGSGGTNRV